MPRYVYVLRDIFSYPRFEQDMRTTRIQANLVLWISHSLFWRSSLSVVCCRDLFISPADPGVRTQDLQGCKLLRLELH
jgi:hypothetical protein